MNINKNYNVENQDFIKKQEIQKLSVADITKNVDSLLDSLKNTTSNAPNVLCQNTNIYNQNSYVYTQNSTKINESPQKSMKKTEKVNPVFVVENYNNGSYYQGEKWKSMRHGQGKFFYSDGGLYDGGWKENKMHGTGILYYANGCCAYNGDWNEDKFQGKGILYNDEPIDLEEEFDFRNFDLIENFWNKYEGFFEEDDKSGEGVLYLTNGEKFIGDVIHGKGKYIKRNGEVVSGYWNENKLIGYC